MPGLLAKYGFPALVGALLGIGFVIWVQPTTTAGVGLLILTVTLIFVICSSAAKLALAKLGNREDRKGPKLK